MLLWKTIRSCRRNCASSRQGSGLHLIICKQTNKRNCSFNLLCKTDCEFHNFLTNSTANHVDVQKLRKCVRTTSLSHGIWQNSAKFTAMLIREKPQLSFACRCAACAQCLRFSRVYAAFYLVLRRPNDQLTGQMLGHVVRIFRLK